MYVNKSQRFSGLNWVTVIVALTIFTALLVSGMAAASHYNGEAQTFIKFVGFLVGGLTLMVFQIVGLLTQQVRKEFSRLHAVLYGCAMSLLIWMGCAGLFQYATGSSNPNGMYMPAALFASAICGPTLLLIIMQYRIAYDALTVGAPKHSVETERLLRRHQSYGNGHTN